MKYIVYPFCRVLYVLLIFGIAYPLAFALGCLATLWTLRIDFLKELFDGENFYEQEHYFLYEGTQYYVYKTAKDFLLNRKSYQTV